MITLLQQGNPTVWVLTAIAIYGTFCIVERVIYFAVHQFNFKELLVGIANLIKQNKWEEVLHQSTKAPGMVAPLFRGLLLHRHFSRKELQVLCTQILELEIPKIEKNFRSIFAIAMVAPLVGLLGTFLGLLDAFQLTQQTNNGLVVDQLALGLTSSLSTSIMGLLIMIPVYLSYFYLTAKAKTLINSLNAAGAELINLIFQAPDENKETVAKRELTQKACNKEKSHLRLDL